ncbi:D-glycero-beta-D-manno-heptose 1-phosphate adenylyltransferase [Nocardioides sp. BP30]|uniref:D-glycero-beta-D-manno-heptose 1-phosphate adenylyltransferase n=1 Tax=Nocardioides sp. BP30 TaxID=3036374 RepID=UPI002469AB6E|nr:D-glycero-beta-D-manno-heptose 1-phosphate adenylyltransferase [Nocardioides sp. BP30]WGL53011.1 D-glycero-beta-D-manno-heptose 1-phosphate adenylyltransferase [Nocardioides sp. BP30]
MIVVAGDALLDADLTGRAARLMPEAPVPVLDELEEVRRPGGAALAAALAARDGAEVVLVAPIAEDEAGEQLRTEIEASGVDLIAVPTSRGTAVKRRVRAGGQSLLRLDSGDGPHGTGPDGTGPDGIGELPAAATEALRGASGVLVADYGRGITAHRELRSVLAGLPRRTPIVWDPHPRGAAPTAGMRLVTPNEAEAGAAGPGLAALADRAAELVGIWRCEAVAVTLGARGALVSRGESSPSVIPAPRVDPLDTCGAGDRFAASALLALAGGALTIEAVQAAVEEAARFVAQGGAAAVGRREHHDPASRDVDGGWEVVERVRAAGGTVVATGGCFDLLHAGHVATLEAARALGDCLVVCLNSDDSVRRLKGPARPLIPAVDRARVLAALTPVDAVLVFEEDTPVEAIRTLRPDVWAKGGDYAGAELPEAALLREWGGQSVVLPYLRGRSTTRIVETARTR